MSTEIDIPQHATWDECCEAWDWLLEEHGDELSEGQEMNVATICDYILGLRKTLMHLRSQLTRIAEAEPTHRAAIQRALDWKPEDEG